MGEKAPKLIIAALVVVGALGYLGYQGIQASGSVTLGLSELVSDPDRFVDRRVMVGGKVVPGSVDNSTGELMFKLHEANAEVAVRYIGHEPIPDGLYADDAEATITGRYRQDGSIEAMTIRTKCASKYSTEDNSMDPTATSA